MATQRYGGDHTQNLPYSAVPPSPPPPPIQYGYLIEAAILAVSLIPSFLFMRLVGLATFTECVSEYINSNLNGPNNLVESQYRLQFTQESSLQRRLLAALAAASSLLATLLFSSLRTAYLLGSPLYNWSLLATVVFCSGFFIDAAISISTAFATFEPRRGHRFKRWSYYSSALGLPLGSVLHATLILLTWQFLRFTTVLYPITSYGAWFFGAWLARSMLILLNLAVMARWRANAVYDRFEERILRVGFQIHIMYALIPSAGFDMSTFMTPWRKKEWEGGIVQFERDDVCRKLEDHIRYFSGYTISTKEVETISRCTESITALLPENWADTIGEAIRLEHGIASDDTMHIDKRWLKEQLRLGDEDARVLYGELCALVTSPHEITYHTFSTWMEGACRNSQAVGQTLRQEDEAIMRSDRLLMGMLINMVFVMWLFFTSNTTIQVFTVIPFVYFTKCFTKELFGPQVRLLI